MIKRTISTAAMAALTVSLAACGQSGSSSNSSGSQPAGSASAATDTIASKMVFGGPPEFKTRRDGIAGLQKVYGVTFGQVKSTDTGGPVTVTQLKNGQIDVADLFSTDPAIEANGFVMLKDPKHNFSAQNVVPIITKDKATPGVKELLDQVSAKLTTDELRTMVGAVQNDHQDPGAVATAWLKKVGLDSTGTSAKGVSLTVGSANFPENVVLADVYATVLKDNGANVSTKLNIGSREKYYPALKAGSINLFPEYNGTLLSYIDKSATARSTQEVDAALAKALPDNLIALKSSPAEDSDSLVVTKATADKYHLVTIGDLAKPAS